MEENNNWKASSTLSSSPGRAPGEDAQIEAILSSLGQQRLVREENVGLETFLRLTSAVQGVLPRGHRLGLLEPSLAQRWSAVGNSSVAVDLVPVLRLEDASLHFAKGGRDNRTAVPWSTHPRQLRDNRAVAGLLFKSYLLLTLDAAQS